jgi:hypothetical protein
MANMTAAGILLWKGTASVNACGIRYGGKPRLDAKNPFLMYLDHDHRESENVRFLAIRPLLVQDLWRSPPRGMALLFRSTSHGIQVLGDPGKAKIGDPRMASDIYKDIRLGTCQYGGKSGLRAITYSLKITVNDAAGVEEAKAVSDIR